MIPPRPLVALLALTATASAAPRRPKFVGTARVKQHMHSSGDLVEGEEHLLKVIVKWDHVAAAQKYELCHMCNHVDEETGAELGVADGTVHDVEAGPRNQCGGQPCVVMPGTAKGHNKYHIRAMVDGEWTAWSRYQNFDVQEPGSFDHVEL